MKDDRVKEGWVRVFSEPMRIPGMGSQPPRTHPTLTPKSYILNPDFPLENHP